PPCAAQWTRRSPPWPTSAAARRERLRPLERRHPEARAQHAQQRRVVRVPGHARRDAAPERTAEQVEVAEDVEDLVAHELVGEAERRVHDALLADEDEVVEPPAIGETHLLELLDLLDEAEGARGRDLAAERLEVGEAEGVFLPADGRGVVEDVVHLEAIGWL